MPETGLDKLKRMTAWDTDPTLTEDELNATLATFAREDLNGYTPADEEWQPTYDLNAAASQAWLTKAAKASTLTEVDPGSGIVTSKVFDNCRTMARIYGARKRTTVNIR